MTTYSKILLKAGALGPDSSEPYPLSSTTGVKIVENKVCALWRKRI